MNSEARQRQENSSIDVTQSVEEDPLIDYPLLYADALVGDVRAPFKGVPTVCWAILLTFLHVAFVVLAFLSVFFCAPPADLCRDILGSFSLLTIITITKVVLWALHAVFEYYLQAQHSKARHRGYLTLYRSTRHLKRLPLLIHSAGNAILLLLLSIWMLLEQKTLVMYLILGALTVELFFSSTCLIIYTAKIIKFNQMEPCPDIQEEERRQRCPNLINVLSETGFRDGSNLENLVEKQADLIDYLKMHNVNLSKRLLALISQQVRD
ncbi:transmembrane protein 192 isoform X1 [Carcharodon carcharias]|uniref:transmembrane protein 192 isoform X1 n=1 Tax=Carcharodon carcharias TaxID=13397 RepID=UPI001B7E9B28|nr:transmembrane protein 192 isoform X1 [Carcharodon carcharias]